MNTLDIFRLIKETNIYDHINDPMKNKLFCSFTAHEYLPETIASITSRYPILYSKLFILESPQTTEYLITYNVDTEKPLTEIPDNTILLHRKKESNSLYTINALNTLIKSLNNGVADSNYRINWSDYKNSVLLTQGDDLRIINTKIFKIIYL
jgi:hypothetical protein